MTECNQETCVAPRGSTFTAGQVSSGGGALLLLDADRKIDLRGGWQPASAMAARPCWSSANCPRC